MVTYEDVVNNIEVKELIKNAQKQLDVLGYTEHSARHVTVVAERAAEVLKNLGYDEHRIELANIPKIIIIIEFKVKEKFKLIKLDIMYRITI